MSIHELQARLKALDEAQASGDQRAIYQAASTVVVWARRVAEGAGEPVGEVKDAPIKTSDGGRVYMFAGPAELPIGTKLYTAPPSADELVEALGKLSAEWRKTAEEPAPNKAVGMTLSACATLIDLAIAKHKENPR